MSSLFTEADVIHSYSRRQAIEDGVLVQLSGDGYEGDPWIPEMVAEIGFRFPVAMTAEAFQCCVAMTPAAEQACNDVQGRLWDVLWLLKLAISCPQPGQDMIWFDLHVVTKRIKPTLVRLKCVCGPGDDAEPVLTIMLPGQD